MTTISVPINTKQEEFIEGMISSGKYENKAQVVRRALQVMSDEEAIQAVLDSEADLKAGRVYRGNIRELIKKIK